MRLWSRHAEWKPVVDSHQQVDDCCWGTRMAEWLSVWVPNTTTYSWQLECLVGDVLKIWGERNPTCVAFLDGAASCSERVRSITDLIRPSYQPDEQQPENVDEQHDRQETEDRPLTYSILVVTGSSSLAAWTNPWTGLSRRKPEYATIYTQVLHSFVHLVSNDLHEQEAHAQDFLSISHL